MRYDYSDIKPHNLEITRTPSPTEEESFEKKITENNKLRAEDYPNGYISKYESDRETEKAKTGSKTDVEAEKTSENTSKMRFRKNSGSSSSSSSSSDSSDSENETSPVVEEQEAFGNSQEVEQVNSPDDDSLSESEIEGARVKSTDHEDLHGSNVEFSDTGIERPDVEMHHGVDTTLPPSAVGEATSSSSSSSSESEDEENPSSTLKVDGKVSPVDLFHEGETSDEKDNETYNSEMEDSTGNAGEYIVNLPESHDDAAAKDMSSSSHSEEEGDFETTPVIKPPSPAERKISNSSSISSSSEEADVVGESPLLLHDQNDEQSDGDILEIAEEHPGVPKLPVVLDTSSSDSDDDLPTENATRNLHSVDNVIENHALSAFVDSPTSTNSASPEENNLHGEDKIVDDVVVIPVVRDTSSSSSSSESDMEDSHGPLVIKQKEEHEDIELTPLSLKKALQERERELEQRRQEKEKIAELGARKASEPVVANIERLTPEFVESYSPEAFDFNGDPSIRARTAFDFDDAPPETPPKLPPKQRSLNPIVAPNIEVQRHASLGRGMWSDDEDELEYPLRHRSLSNHHPPADRVIDFSNNSDGAHSLKRSRSRNKNAKKKENPRQRSKEKRRNRSPSPSGSRSADRVIDFTGRPYEDPQNAINRQAMVSLHANTYDTDAYDSVQETGDELNKLIEKANSLGYHHNYQDPVEDVFRRKKLPQKKLESKHPDAFAKIVAPLPTQPAPPQPQYRATVQSDRQISDNSRKSSRGLSRKKRKTSHQAEAVDGDDEISLAESDINRFQSPSPLPEPQPSVTFVTEPYQSDYTEFETFSEAEFQDTNKGLDRVSYLSRDSVKEIYNPGLQTAGESAYDTVPDNDQETDIDISPKGKLNPIVSSNFQICSDISGSKSFPSRLREGQPQKKRPGLGHLAISLNQTSKKRNQYPTSLPYFGNDFTEEEEFDKVPRRTGSVDDIPGIYPIINPSIIVHRQATHPKGFYPEVAHEVMMQHAPTETPPLPEKREKKKKEKKEKKKEAVEKPTPQINLTVESADGDSANLNNNLRINLLPSDDPNVINLNIRSTSVNAAPQSLPIIASQPQYMPTQQNQMPVSAMVHATPPIDNQHKVIEVTAPPLIHTGDDLPPTAPYYGTGGVMLAGGVPTEILPYPMIASATQQYGSTPQPQRLPSYPAVSLTQAPQAQPSLLPATQSLPAGVEQTHAPMIQTNVSTPPVQQPSLQPNNEATVVDVHSPWPLPEDRRSAKESTRMRRGDSGIDLTMHDRNRRPRSRTPKGSRRRLSSRSSTHRESSSSSDTGSRRRKRPSSQKKLRSNDFLERLTPSNEYLDWYKEKHLKPSCCYLFIKHLLFAINLIFTLVGLALVGLGIWGMVTLHQNGLSDPGVIFLDPLFSVMVVGFLVSLVAFHGAAGFIRDNICMLKCFGSLLVILFIAFVVGGIAFWATLGSVKDLTISVYSNLIQQYNDETRVGLSYSIDTMQNTFQCCGIADPGASQWAKNELFKCQANRRCPLPDSCCKKTSDLDFKCLASSDMIYHQSCIDAMSSAVAKHTPVIVGVWVGIWALMMIEMMCIYIMCKEIAYLQKIRNFLDDPVKHMKMRQKQRISEESSEDSTEESDSETSSSEEEYRRRKKKNNKKREKKEKSNKKKKKARGKRTSKRGRRGSYHVNRTVSIQDERSSHGRRSRRGSSRSRGRRGSY